MAALASASGGVRASGVCPSVVTAATMNTNAHSVRGSAYPTPAGATSRGERARGGSALLKRTGEADHAYGASELALGQVAGKVQRIVATQFKNIRDGDRLWFENLYSDGVLRALDTLGDGQQGPEVVTGAGRVPRKPARDVRLGDDAAGAWRFSGRSACLAGSRR